MRRRLLRIPVFLALMGAANRFHYFDGSRRGHMLGWTNSAAGTKLANLQARRTNDR
jgi:hypothetical protein